MSLKFQNWDPGPISPTFYEQQLRTQIPKAQKDSKVKQLNFAFGICLHKVKLTPLSSNVIVEPARGFKIDMPGIKDILVCFSSELKTTFSFLFFSI